MRRFDRKKKNTKTLIIRKNKCETVALAPMELHIRINSK